MHPSDLIFPYDLVRLPRERIEEVCKEFRLPTEGSLTLLADEIYEKLIKDKDKNVREAVFQLVGKTIFAGRRAVTWHRLPEKSKDVNLETAFYKKLGVKPFDHVIERDPESLGSAAEIIAAAPYYKDNRYILRFMVKSGINRISTGLRFVYQPVSTIVTAVIDLEQGFLEVRDDPRWTDKVLKVIADLLQDEVEESIVTPWILEPFGGQIDKLADALNGIIIGTDSKPELILEDISEDQFNAVTSVLSAIDAYFEDEDITKLEVSLSECRTALEAFAGVPFFAVLLAGMKQLGLSMVLGDVRAQPLFNVLKPHLQQQGGFIRFPVIEDGLEVLHTIRIGLATNSVSFRTYATEKAIEVVRNTVLGF